jgi:signal transduction histidine kinase
MRYQRAVILRRVARRMRGSAAPGLRDYCDYLRHRKLETKLLLKNLLISVTNFFRGRSAPRYRSVNQPQILQVNLDVSKRNEVEEESDQALRQIVKTQQEERRRLSRELHDNFGQQLTALRLGLESLHELSRGQRHIGERIEELRDLAKRLDAEMGFLAWQLRPTVLDDLGLASAIENFIEEWSKYFEIAAEFHTARMDDDRFAPEIEINLYRIAQEALNNVSKHARANRVNVILERRNNQLALIVEDNGVGLASRQDMIPGATTERLGVTGMRERAALIGGVIEIESSPRGGTTVFVRIPLKPTE